MVYIRRKGQLCLKWYAVRGIKKEVVHKKDVLKSHNDLGLKMGVMSNFLLNGDSSE